MIDLLLFPFGGNAREALMAILAQNDVQPQWNVLGFLDDDKRHWSKEFCGVHVLGGKELISNYPNAKIFAVPGNPDNFHNRQAVIASLSLPLDRFATVLDPTVRVAPDAQIGRNTLIMANVFLSVSTRIGNHCVILPNTVISHDVQIDDYTLVGSNVSISGACRVECNCYIGSGTRIKGHLQIGKQSMIGLGSNVVQNVPDNIVVVGNPARVIKQAGEDG